MNGKLEQIENFFVAVVGSNKSRDIQQRLGLKDFNREQNFPVMRGFTANLQRKRVSESLNFPSNGSGSNVSPRISFEVKCDIQDPESVPVNWGLISRARRESDDESWVEVVKAEIDEGFKDLGVTEEVRRGLFQYSANDKLVLRFGDSELELTYESDRNRYEGVAELRPVGAALS
jgi:hypothetical protein